MAAEEFPKLWQEPVSENDSGDIESEEPVECHSIEEVQALEANTPFSVRGVIRGSKMNETCYVNRVGTAQSIYTLFGYPDNKAQ